MKVKCPKCGTGKARRSCPRNDNVEICSECCANIRDEDCGDCVHYAAVRQYEDSRNLSSGLPAGHFLMEINPEVQESVNKALDLLQRGWTARARAILTGLVHDHPRNHDVTFGIGVLHAVDEKHQEAIEWFDKAIAIYPYSVEAHYNKAVAFQKMLDLPNCVKSYQKVIEIGGPNDPEVAQARSIVAGFSATILENEGIKLELYLKSGELFSQAFGLMEAGDWQGALDGFRASSAINDRNAPCHGNMGLCHAYLGQKSLALSELDRALEIDPDYEPARSNREVASRMEEGRPLSDSTFKTINYGLEDYVDGGNALPGISSPARSPS